jgi:hypothetical protein
MNISYIPTLKGAASERDKYQMDLHIKLICAKRVEN